MTKSNNYALKIEKLSTNPGVFVLRFGSSLQYYILARTALSCDLADPGVILSHQSIELLVKAILPLDYLKHGNHNLITLFQNSQKINSFFGQCLKDSEINIFLTELTSAYGDKNGSLRYSESKSEINLGLIIPLLDKIIAGLKIAYESTIKYPEPLKIYCPPDLKEIFLKGNKYFNVEDLTNNPLSMFGLPI